MRSFLPLYSLPSSTDECGLRVIAGLTQPTLFDSLILVDPIIRPLRPNDPITSPGIFQYIVGSIGRRHDWPSRLVVLCTEISKVADHDYGWYREEAKALFSASPFYKTWDPQVLDVWVECGLKDKDGGGVELKIPGIQVRVPYPHSCFVSY